MITVEEKKLFVVERHVLIGEECDEHHFHPNCICGVGRLENNHFYSEALEDYAVENVYLHSQLKAHKKATYMTLTFKDGKQLNNKTLQVI